VARGIEDIRQVFPAVTERVAETYDEFNQELEAVASDRWIGSVNARLYGRNRHVVPDGKIGVLAAVVKGVYETLAPNAKLIDSMALKRVAEMAPVVGGVLGQAALHSARDERLRLDTVSASADG
jgi:hypothetical protein